MSLIRLEPCSSFSSLPRVVHQRILLCVVAIFDMGANTNLEIPGLAERWTGKIHQDWQDISHRSLLSGMLQLDWLPPGEWPFPLAAGRISPDEEPVRQCNLIVARSKLTLCRYSWAKYTNMIWVEQPVRFTLCPEQRRRLTAAGRHWFQYRQN